MYLWQSPQLSYHSHQLNQSFFLIMFNQRRFRGVINEDGYRYDVEVSAPHLHAAYDIVQRREGIKRSQIVYVQEV